MNERVLVIGTHICCNCSQELTEDNMYSTDIKRRYWICKDCKRKRSSVYKKYHHCKYICPDCGKKMSSVKGKRCWLCWLKSHSTKFKEPDYDDSFGNWLCGFVDGEGNFNRIKGHGQAFRIKIREDDRAILEEIKDRLGCGVIYDVDKSLDRKNHKNTRDQCMYIVATIVDLVNVVIPLFDKYELRAKKRNDYIIWRKTILDKWNGWVDKYE